MVAFRRLRVDEVGAGSVRARIARSIRRSAGADTGGRSKNLLRQADKDSCGHPEPR
jgi:hypothetical protein